MPDPSAPGADLARPPVVGLDLDLTLVDTVPGLAATPGAHEALAAVRRHRGRTLLVTGGHVPHGQRQVDRLGLDVDRVEGRPGGVGLADVLRGAGVTVHVGGHGRVVAAARAAGATSVGVLTGGSGRAELEAAGAGVVLADLAAFPGWLDEHLLAARLAALEADLATRESVLVAYSGGADSALVLAAAVRALGPERVVAATGRSAALPAREVGPAEELAKALGVRVLAPATHEMEREGYRANAGDRCFFCKAELLETLVPLAAEHGIAHVATGTNADDVVAGFRPGIRAAAERGALTPLADAGLSKAQVREASRRWGLPTWDKPAAACLSSRVAFGIEVTPHRLARVERAEAAVRDSLAGAGLATRDLRVRDLGASASVEVDAALLGGGLAEGAPGRVAVLEAVRAAGFAEVGLDERGFRSGSMNERLAEPGRWR